MCGYAIAPGVTNLTTLMWTTVGTSLCVFSANAFNQWMEHPFDAQMSRTRSRPLVKRVISPLHAFAFGASTGLTGTAILLSFVNPLTAVLGLANIYLYAGVYTPMKRKSIWNTWVGSVVGAIPPLMGWAACTGSLDPGSLVLAGILYAWQFPHFNSLSWNLKEDYAKAGYRMMSVLDPALNARVSLRYSLLLIPICISAVYFDLTTEWFALDSSTLNLVMSFYAFRFYKSPSSASARKLFFMSLIHLPLVMSMLLIHKKDEK